MTKYLGSLITADESKNLPSNNFKTTSANGVWNLNEQLMLNRQSKWPTAGLDNPANSVENIFNVYAYTGTGSSQTITNGIDLSSEGGLVIIRSRSDSGTSIVFDSERGVKKKLEIAAPAEVNRGSGQALNSFNSNGFTISGDSANDNINTSGREYVAWTFRKAPKFFDVVTYTGDGTTTKTVSHNLGSTPAMIIFKNRDRISNWVTYHANIPASGYTQPYLRLNGDIGITALGDYGYSLAPTSTVIRTPVHSNASGNSTDNLNIDGESYVAYIFGHDTSSDGIMQCGSFTTNSSGNYDGSTVLGFEPQWLIWKSYDASSDNWPIVDTLRGWGRHIWNFLYVNDSTAESPLVALRSIPTQQGFAFFNGQNQASKNYIYMAIRRGLMSTPTSRASVFDIDTEGQTGDGKAPAFRFGGTVDMYIKRIVTSQASNTFGARLINANFLDTDTSDALSINTGIQWDYNNGVETSVVSNSNNYAWMWKRAPGFFDVVYYEGNGSNRTITHNLGVVPEMMWIKNTSSTEDWAVYYGDATDYLKLNFGHATADDNTYWNDTAPTSTVFTVGTNDSVNHNAENHIALLFATLSGISKIGTFSHTNGSSTDVDCGFSSGSKFVLVKRTDSTSDWYLWDSSRGIVAGNDPYIILNTDTAQNSSYDYIDTLNSGFQMSSSFTTGSYIFYAIAT